MEQGPDLPSYLKKTKEHKTEAIYKAMVFKMLDTSKQKGQSLLRDEPDSKRAPGKHLGRCRLGSQMGCV